MMENLNDAPVCPACVGDPALFGAMLDGEDTPPLPPLEDPEGDHLPTSLPPVVDAHVHLFDGRLFEAIWRWFDARAWPVRYRLKTPEVIPFLLSRGVSHIVALQYAHKPGMARTMNRWMADVVTDHPQVTGLATAFPGEPDAGLILNEAFDAGLSGVKVHCHVQAVPPDSEAMSPIYDACVARDMPLVMHAGREPASDAYPVHPHKICAADRVEEVLRSWPKLRLCVPHLGADELDAYLDLLERYDNLWLDTTMVVADYFPLDDPHRLVRARPERIMYGTDFPNIPYAWDREVHRLAAHHDEATLGPVLGETAHEFFRLKG